MGIIDMDKIAVIGQAGGGQIAVREAFAGANYKAVSSFYNNLNTFPFPEDPTKVTAKIQIHVSKDDSRNKPGLAESVKSKIKSMNIPVTFYEYDGEHFAIPNQYGEDSTYNEQADKESFERTVDLFKQVLGQ
jgi:dienelactone hydrolase